MILRRLHGTTVVIHVFDLALERKETRRSDQGVIRFTQSHALRKGMVHSKPCLTRIAIKESRMTLNASGQ
jgi:hypothetical protein